jgi:hypothetical protein
MNFKSIIPIFIITIFLAVSLAACAGAKPEDAVSDYLNALVNKDSSSLSALSCADWESNALLELDSFQAVDVRLEDAACSVTGKDGDTTLVQCQGKLIATYNNEDMELNLSDKIYKVVEQKGDYLVCGYK